MRWNRSVTFPLELSSCWNPAVPELNSPQRNSKAVLEADFYEKLLPTYPDIMALLQDIRNDYDIPEISPRVDNLSFSFGVASLAGEGGHVDFALEARR